MKLWWDLFIRTGIPPRALKAMLTFREYLELFAYCSRYPITDEANLQVPQARMYASYLNAHRIQGAEPAQITDFILGYPSANENEGHDDDDEDEPVTDSDILEGKGW